MSTKYIICDRNVVGLLLLLHEREEVITSELIIVNSNYSLVRPVADKMLHAGILESRPSDKHCTKTYWRMTDKGQDIANLLFQAERQLSKTRFSEKYYKW